jgi:hypothetical protein
MFIKRNLSEGAGIQHAADFLSVNTISLRNAKISVK